MTGRFGGEIRWRIAAIFCVLGVAAILIVGPLFSSSKAGMKKGLFERTAGAKPAVENFDIRENPQKGTESKLAEFRQTAGKGSEVVDEIRNGFTRGEEALRARIPNIKVEYNSDIRTPEVIGPDVWGSRTFLTKPAFAKGGRHSDILLNFLKENNSLVGTTAGQIDSLRVAADYTNPDGNLSFVELDQEINGLPVFRGTVKAGFTKNGEMIRVINNLAPGLDYQTLSTDFGDPVTALKTAAANVSSELRAIDTAPNTAASTDQTIRFGSGGDFDNTAEKMYFPTEPGVAVPAWRVLIWGTASSYYVIVDAKSGTVLWRKNLTSDQTQPATYNVYSATTNLGKAMNSAAPMSPGPSDPSGEIQAPLGLRTNVTLIGNEGPLSFNNLGWMTDGTNGVDGWTDGNAVEAGLDIVSPDGIDPNGKANGTGRVFNFSYIPSNVTGGIEGGDAVTGSAFRNGVVTNLFYLNNRYHDALYQVGFTEAARNFQNDNFGRGGNANDRVFAEAQDFNSTNNADFNTPADGGRGRMRMYLFTNGSAPARDGSLDAEVVFHEHTHGLSERLIGNAVGLSSTRARGSGEGWSDLYAFLLTVDPTEPVDSIFTTGSYVTYKCCGVTTFTQNYFYGIRRFPYAIKSVTGGPNNRPYNPLTFGDLNTVTATDGAFPCSPLINCNSATEVHNAGEIWAMAGIEVWAKLATRLGTAAGTLKTMQLYTDAMKLSPNNPNFIASRNALISAATASSFGPEAAADVADVREGFRIRGMGFTAADTGTVATESFDKPNVIVANPFSVTDSVGNNNGVPEPGENVLLNIAVTNPNTGLTINNVQVSVNGGQSVNFGTIANNATVNGQVPFTVPASDVCGASQTVTINVTSDAGDQTPGTRSFTVGTPVITTTQNFDGVTAPAIPATWISTQDEGTNGITWVTTATGPSSAPNSAFANDPSMVSISSLESPSIAIGSIYAQVKFKNKYVTENTFDGAVLEIKIGAGSYLDILDAGGSFQSGGYNNLISTAHNNPLGGRSAWTGTSAGGYIDTVVNLPAAANGQNIKLRWRMASDDSVPSTGINIDDVQFTTSFTCAAVQFRSRADFDGDGKSDLSVFRPSDGNWYLNQSTAGFAVVKWGVSTDTIIPGDYDGDGKADYAVWRPTATDYVADFYILNSNGFTLSGYAWGLPGDIPMPGDYDGDGKIDIAVYRPSTTTWWIFKSQTQSADSLLFGSSGDIPMVMDFNGDGKADLALFRPSTQTWLMNNASGTPSQNPVSVQWGLATDILVPADYDGDGKDDVAVFRPSTGTWYIVRSLDGGITTTQFGATGDIPVPGDYDGDGIDDIAVYRNGTWYLNGSASGFSSQQFGISTDIPVPSAYHP